MTRQQFDSLPIGAVIEYRRTGQRFKITNPSNGQSAICSELLPAFFNGDATAYLPGLAIFSVYATRYNLIEEK